MNNQIERHDNNQTGVLEALVLNGDLSRLSGAQKIEWYRMRCEAAGLDPNTKPFDYLKLSGKEVLYATKAATEQLCEKRKLSCEIINEGFIDDLYRVHARVVGADGRHSDNIGVVTAGNLKGDALANAMMKAVTKAFRRAVLSHCGLGMLDETEIETIPGARVEPDVTDTVELASEAEVARYNELLADARARGLAGKDGAPVRDCPPQIERAKLAQRTAKLCKWLQENPAPEPEMVEAESAVEAAEELFEAVPV